MLRHVSNLIAFLIALVTITALAVVFMIQSATTPMEIETEPTRPYSGFYVALLWVGGVGGFISAVIVALRTAWAIYYIDRAAKVTKPEDKLDRV